jgi:hypothetical protein
MASTPMQQSGMGAGILSTMRQIGSVMGISVLGAILQNQLVNNITSALAKVPQLPPAIKDQIVQGLTSGGINMGGANVPSNIPPFIRDLLIAAFKNQFAISLNTAMKVGIVVILVGTASSLLISSHIRKSKGEGRVVKS